MEPDKCSQAAPNFPCQELSGIGFRPLQPIRPLRPMEHLVLQNLPAQHLLRGSPGTPHLVPPPGDDAPRLPREVAPFEVLRRPSPGSGTEKFLKMLETVGDSGHCKSR